MVIYYNAPHELRTHYEDLPQHLTDEGIEPAVPWLYNYRLDFRFVDRRRAAPSNKPPPENGWQSRGFSMDNKESGRQRGRPRLPRTFGISVINGSPHMTSATLAADSATCKGIPLPSVMTWCLFSFS